MTVSVIFYFTAEFQAVTPDIEGHIGGLIENTNVAFLRSNIPVQLAIHCIVKSPVGEAPDSAARIREFKQSRGEQNLNSISIVDVLGAHLWLVRGFVKFVFAVAYHFCLNLSAAFSQPSTSHKCVPSRSPSHTSLLQAVSRTYFSLQILQSS